MITDPLSLTTKVSKKLNERYYTYTLIGHYGSFSTTSALTSIVSSEIFVLAPKVLHEVLKDNNPELTVVTPQSCLKNMPDAETILWLYALRNPFTASAVLKRRKPE